ncbi:hypothetical protein [Amycolatopsis sp. MJM2582]|uniref:hypothetical protein n=1 Tax=Amycolatopsis sp. MJM2582 TaxID=1427749 RepID=UPI0012698F10
MRRLDLFGSVVSDRFDLRSSDVDVLVEFSAFRTGQWTRGAGAGSRTGRRLWRHPQPRLRDGLTLPRSDNATYSG